MPTGGRRGSTPVAVPLVPVVCAVGVATLYKALTGSWVSSSVADKSLLANYGLRDTVAVVSQYALDIGREYFSHARVQQIFYQSLSV